VVKNIKCIAFSKYILINKDIFEYISGFFISQFNGLSLRMQYFKFGILIIEIDVQIIKHN